MVTQYDSLEKDEFVLRRVLNQSEYINTSLPAPVQRIAFWPTADDVDGLSVFRGRFVTPEIVASTGTNPKGYYVIRISYKDILDLGLTVIPNAQDDQPEGHSLIPEIESSYNIFTKQESKIKQQALATLVSKNISTTLVYEP